MNDIIKKIVLDLGNGKEIELTLAQGKKLKEILDELFGEKVVTVREPHPIPMPYPLPYPLPYPDRDPWRWPRPYSPIWISGSSGAQARFVDNTMTITLTAGAQSAL